MRPAIFLLLFLALAACAGGGFRQALLDAGTVSAMPALHDPQTIDSDTLLLKFEAVAFESEFGRTGGKSDNHSLTKWGGAIRVAALSAPGIDISSYRPLLDAHLERLSALTGLTVLIGDDPAKANFQVNFVPRRVMRARTLEMFGRSSAARHMAKIGRCVTATYTDEGNAIKLAIVYVSVDLPPQQVAGCIIEEVVQGLGLLNDTDRLRPSLFSDRDTLPDMPWYDEILVATLYDKRLRPGMKRAEALPLARQVIGELLPGFRPTGEGITDGRG